MRLVVSITGDHRTLTVERADGEPLTYENVARLMRGLPGEEDKLKHLKVLLRA